MNSTNTTTVSSYIIIMKIQQLFFESRNHGAH